MKTLLIGANGQVGYELATRLAGSPLVATTRSGAAPFEGIECVALDVGDATAIRDLIFSSRADVVINASAYTAVDRAESEEALAFRINAEAPRIMAEACVEAGSRLVHYSTDYVFDGSARTPYRTDSTVSPLGVYGRSKREGEKGVLASGADALIIRTAWVYGTRGQNFLRTILRLGRERDEIRVVDDQVGTPTPAWLVADITLQILQLAAPAGIQNVVAAGQASWFDFACAICEAAGERGLLDRAPIVVAIPSSDYPTPAVRPSYSVLDVSSLTNLGITVPHWLPVLAETLDRECRNSVLMFG